MSSPTPNPTKHPRRRASDHDQDNLLSFVVGLLLGWGFAEICMHHVRLPW